jgi:hypothetical protein
MMTTKFLKNPTGDFEQDFGFEFGKQANGSIYFGSRGWLEDNPTDVEGWFITPLHVEERIYFDCSAWANMGGDRVLIISDHPNAEPDDEGVVDSRLYIDGIAGGAISLFVNDNPTDPKPPEVRDGTQKEPYLRPRKTWLKQGTKYYYRIKRLKLRSDGKHTPLMLRYSGTSPADGKEIPLAAPTTEPMPAPIPIEEHDITIDGVRYLLVPVDQ